jgi:hypothetical protein
VKDQSYELAFYTYSDILDSNVKYTDIIVDPEKKIDTENKFRKQLRTILQLE